MENKVTKTEWVLEGLHEVEEFHRNRPVLPGRINLHQMVQDCIDVIEDLNKQIEIMKIELNDRNFVIDHMFVNMNEDPTAIFAAEMLKIQTENEAEKHNALLEKMRAELRGDICE